MSYEEYVTLREDFCSTLKEQYKTGKVKYDLNGHIISRDTKPENIQRALSFRMEEMRMPLISLEEMKLLLDAMKNGKSLDKFYYLGGSVSFCCNNCGRNIGDSFDGKILKIVDVSYNRKTLDMVIGGACEFPNVLAPYKFRVSFNSGKIVVANDLRELYPEAPTDYDESTPDDQRYLWSLQGEIGTNNHALFHAKNGWIHFYVSNQQCLVNKLAKDKLIIGSDGYNETEDGEEEIPLQGINVASICTDLWWASLADLEDVKSRLTGNLKEASNKDIKKYFHASIVSIQPGEYEVEVSPLEVKRGIDYIDGDVSKKPRVYCTINRI